MSVNADKVLLERLQLRCSPTASRVQKVKGFPPLVDLRREEKQSRANRDKERQSCFVQLINSEEAQGLI